MKKTIKRIFNKFGYSISKIKKTEYPIDYSKEFIREYQEIEPYTMTSIERVFALMHRGAPPGLLRSCDTSAWDLASFLQPSLGLQSLLLLRVVLYQLVLVAR